ncbi:MAG TPA: PD-(D/E)XK nuclease family protein [Bacilli bacterium]|nr:PD-(D/E)XK nuclease family protein [Bacilli bacterium]
MAKRLIIAPFSMHESLLNAFRQKDSFTDLKIIDKNELLHSFYDQLDQKSIKEVMISENISHDAAIKIVRALPFATADVSTEKMSHLHDIKAQLKTLGLLKRNPYITMLLKGKDVEVFGYSSLDKELVGVLTSLKCRINFNINEVVKKDQPLLQFSSIPEEVLFNLNQIAQLLDSGVKASDIYVYCCDHDYYYYLDEFQNSFHFRLNIPQYQTLYSQNSTCWLLQEIRQRQSFDQIGEIFSQISIPIDHQKMIQKMIKEVMDERLSFARQYQYLVYLLKQTHISDNVYSPAVNFIEEPIMANHANVFVLGFHEGLFPISYQDNDFLTDQEKSLLGLNTSLDKGKMSIHMLTNFFAQDNAYHFSYSRRHLNNQYYPSPFAKIWGMHIANAELPETYFSHRYAEMTLANLCDLNKFFKEQTEDYRALLDIISIPYDSYDNQFTGAKVFDDSTSLKHSYSSMKAYYACPFQYYLAYGLDLDPFKGNFSSALGNIAHQIFQNMSNQDFDFEQAYQNAYAGSDYQFTESEKTLLIELKTDMNAAVQAIKLHQSKMSSHQIFAELKIKMPLDDRTIIEGIVDKIIIVSNQYMFLVDYKTGKETFVPALLKYGSSFQLPTYALLTSQSPQFKDYTLTGLYIQHVIPDSISRTIKEDDLIPYYLKLDGYSIDDASIIHMFDDTFGVPGEESSFIKGIKLTKDNQFSKRSRIQSQEYLHSLSKSALDLFVEGNKSIRRNIFPVRPLFADSDGACKYCPYHDICYVKFEQIVDVKDIQEQEAEDNGI